VDLSQSEDEALPEEGAEDLGKVRRRRRLKTEEASAAPSGYVGYLTSSDVVGRLPRPGTPSKLS